MPLFSQQPQTSARIVQTTQAPLNKEQKAFNNLIRKIEAKRARLAEWDTAAARFKQEYAAGLMPLQEEETDLQFRLAQALDRAHTQKGLTKSERRKLAIMIVDLARAVLEHTEHDELKGLYNKHSQSDFDDEEAAGLEVMKSMLEDVLGMDLGEDVDMRCAEDVLKRVESQSREQEERREAKAVSRRKSAKQQAREAQLEAQEKQVSQSIREVYRKLASSLHPDREPDPAEKQRKTELMQRANEAYDKGNLLQLLELQLQLEHIDQSHLAAIGPQQRKHYIKILNGQLRELGLETQRVEDEFAAQFGLSPFERYDPKDLMPMLHADLSACEVRIRQLGEHLEAASDVPRLKAWLKAITLRRQPQPDFDFAF